MDAVDNAGYIAGEDVVISLDIAASDLYDGTKYKLPLNKMAYTHDEFCDLMKSCYETDPIISIEDPFIVQLSAATNAGQLKVESSARSERMVKSNEVIRIQRQIGSASNFIGARIYD